MPVKNAAPFLDECIISILEQTETDWELVAVDDSSSDDSFRMLRSFSEKDQRIRVFRNSGTGIIDALRSALDHATGQLITRMDADDKMSPQKLKVLKRNLNEAGQGHIAVGKVKYFSTDQLGDGYKKYESWLNNLSETGSNYDDIYRECVIPSPCWMVYLEDLKKCDAFDKNTYPEDYDLCFRFYREKLKVVPCSCVLHYWRDHPERSSRNDENYADNSFLELKTNWFLKLDRNPLKPLVLWGAGKKGKAIAKILDQQKVTFIWVCNNQKKIGKHIYGVEMKATSELDQLKDPQIIVAVASPNDQPEILNTLNSEAFWFC